MATKWLKIGATVAGVVYTIAGAVRDHFDRKSADVKLTEKVNEIIDSRFGKES